MDEKRTKNFTTKKVVGILSISFLVALFGVYLSFYHIPKTQHPNEILVGKAISEKEFSARPFGRTASVNVSGHLVKFSVIDSSGKEKIIEIPVTNKELRKKIFGKSVKIARYKNWPFFEDKYEIYE